MKFAQLESFPFSLTKGILHIGSAAFFSDNNKLTVCFKCRYLLCFVRTKFCHFHHQSSDIRRLYTRSRTCTTASICRTPIGAVVTCQQRLGEVHLSLVLRFKQNQHVVNGVSFTKAAFTKSDFLFRDPPLVLFHFRLVSNLNWSLTIPSK